jgi:hypothetical protein
MEFAKAMRLLSTRDQLVEWIKRNKKKVEWLVENAPAGIANIATFALLEIELDVEWEPFDEEEVDDA